MNIKLIKQIVLIIFVSAIIIVVVATPILPLFYGPNQVQNNSTTNSPTLDSKIKLKLSKLELATTLEEREMGLMNRSELCDTCGMLFVFPDSIPRSFWMKNTFIPLTIIFMDSGGKIVKIGNGVPLQETPTVNSVLPAQYVLELATTNNYNLQPNDTIDLEFLSNSISS
jgi:uncharacterized membrane protein (UPF0127 family)